MRAAEELAGHQLVDRAHRVRLAAARLAVHQYARRRLASRRKTDERRDRVGVDRLGGGATVEDAVERERVVRDEQPPAVGLHPAVVDDHGLPVARYHVKLAGLRLVAEDGSLSHANSEPACASAFAVATVAVTMLNGGLSLVGILAEQPVVVPVLGNRSHKLGRVVAPRRALVHISNWL